MTTIRGREAKAWNLRLFGACFKMLGPGGAGSSLYFVNRELSEALLVQMIKCHRSNRLFVVRYRRHGLECAAGAHIDGRDIPALYRPHDRGVIDTGNHAVALPAAKGLRWAISQPLFGNECPPVRMLTHVSLHAAQ
ncbi:MAG: hypothetical protein AAF394_07750, partial [Planctomycetota bacterium]